MLATWILSLAVAVGIKFGLNFRNHSGAERGVASIKNLKASESLEKPPEEPREEPSLFTARRPAHAGRSE